MPLSSSSCRMGWVEIAKSAALAVPSSLRFFSFRFGAAISAGGEAGMRQKRPWKSGELLSNMGRDRWTVFCHGRVSMTSARGPNLRQILWLASHTLR